ncbi:MAG: hypothetical protein PF480_06495 [Roseovarius sp.]|jgi:hypothetical protein|nr:hypothetical protein [Roseovarius sp.]
MKPDLTEPSQAPRALQDKPKERSCLQCAKKFWSEGFGERVCRRCKGLSAWRDAVPSGAGTSRNR